MRSDVIVAFFSGVVLTLLIVLLMRGENPIYAQTANSAGGFVAVTGAGVTDQHDYLYLVDTESKRVLAYDYQNRVLNLMAARNIRYDLMLDEWRPNSQRPSVLEVFRQTEGQKKKEATEKKENK